MIDGPEVRRTADGLLWCPLIAERKRLISPASEEFRVICEARYVLSLPLDQRMALMTRIAAKRARSNVKGDREAAAGEIVERLKDAVKAEWEWRQEQARDAEGAQAA